MAHRSRKRGSRRKPAARAPASAAPTPPFKPGGWRVEPTRSQRRDAEARAALKPLAPGERPGAVTAGAAVAALLAIGNLISYVAGAKIAGKHPAAGGIVVFSGLMLACAIGMWRLWYGAVLAFMALLAIIVTLFSLLFIEASNALGFLVPPVVIAGAGYLFYKLVRALGRIQMPKYPGR
ncbi:MAG: hypothetical protein JO156_09165 [Solirubrobacterales bacterium]|nr:hypothetical protein [Solirubrobacterales bacterium]